MLALPIYRAGIHTTGCGFHESIYDDPEHHTLTPTDDTCPGCAALDKYNRILREREASKFKHDTPAEISRPSDGRIAFLKHSPRTPPGEGDI